MQRVLPPLLTPGPLLYRNLLLLSLPPHDAFTLSPSLFALSSPPQHRALQHVLHHLLTTLHSLPSPLPALSSSPLFLSLPSTLRHCYPCYDSAQQREFLQLCLDLLKLLENSGLLPAGSVRRSFLQDGRGEKLERLLWRLSSLVLEEKLRAAGEDLGEAGGLQDGADMEQAISRLQQRAMAAGATLRSELQTMAREQDDWAEAAEAMYGQWKAVSAELRAAQEEEQRLSGSIDPDILSAAGEQRRAEMAADIVLQQQRLQDFMLGSEEDRGRLEAMAAGDWQPTVLTAEQLQQGRTTAQSPPSVPLSLPAAIRCWKEELCLLRDALQAEQGRSEETVSLQAQLQRQTAQQQSLQQQMQRLTQRLQAELLRCTPQLPPALPSAPLSPIFSLCSAACLRSQPSSWDTEALVAESQPLPSLAELGLDEEEEEEAGEGEWSQSAAQRKAAGQPAESGSGAAVLQDRAAPPQAVAAVSDGDAAQARAFAGLALTPVKAGGRVRANCLLLSSPAYMGGGGLLDESAELSELTQPAAWHSSSDR